MIFDCDGVTFESYLDCILYEDLMTIFLSFISAN